MTNVAPPTSAVSSEAVGGDVSPAASIAGR